MKYKVGDRVTIINNKKGIGHRANYIGLTGTISKIEPNGKRTYDEPHYSVSLKEFCPYIFFESELALVNTQKTQKIVITSDGAETLARLYENGKVVKSATAKCSPEDAFDFNIGAKLAFDRLIESTAEKKEQYYNGKVVCIKESAGLTVGKIYEFIDGKLKDDDGSLRPCPLSPNERTKSLDKGWASDKFIALVEETKGE